MEVAGCRLCHGQGSFWGDSVGRNPTDRGKAGSDRSLLVDSGAGPLKLVMAAANVHGTKLLAITLDSIVAERPDAGIEQLCLEKGCYNPTGHGAVAAYGYLGHMPRIGEEKQDARGKKRYPARRWAVELTLTWLYWCSTTRGCATTSG